MVQINFAQKTVNAKIVYYGPGMSGKTTNLEVVHQRAPEQNRGDLTSISTDGDRTLFFDFMPLDLGTVAGMRTAFQIYTVPGQVYYNSTRKLVLQGVDGVVFVADSSPSMVEENLESLRNLEENLNEYGKSMATLPVVIQFNKRDLPDALPVDEMNARLNAYGAPVYEAVANTGQGVFPTLKALAAAVLENIHKTSGPSSAPPAPAAAPPPPVPQMAPPPQPVPVAPQPQPMVQQPVPAYEQPFAPAPAAHGGQTAATNFQQQQAVPMPPPQQQPYQAPMQAAPQAPPPMQQHPQAQAGLGVQQQPPAQQAQPGGLRMAGPPPASSGAGGAGMRAPSASMAPAPVQPPRPPMPSAATRKKLEQTRFRPRSARPEPRATPVAKSTGSKAYTWIFVALALAVGAVLTKVIVSFF